MQILNLRRGEGGKEVGGGRGREGGGRGREGGGGVRAGRECGMGRRVEEREFVHITTTYHTQSFYQYKVKV